MSGQKSPTAGMTTAERVAHVGGWTTEEGFVKFGSIMAVGALMRHLVRDMNVGAQALQQEALAMRLDKTLGSYADSMPSQAYREIEAVRVALQQAGALQAIAPLPEATHKDLIAMVDAAMVEMANISPPLRRKECERLICAALAAQAPRPEAARAARADLPRRLSEAIEEVGLDAAVKSGEERRTAVRVHALLVECKSAICAPQEVAAPSGYIAEINRLKQEVRELKAFRAMVNRHAPEFPADPDGSRDVWYWQGDHMDHLESMTHTLPVVVRAEQLRELLSKASASPPAQEFTDAVVREKLRLSLSAGMCWHGLWSVETHRYTQMMISLMARAWRDAERAHSVGAKA